MKACLSAWYLVVLFGICCPALADSEEDWWKVYTGAELSDGDAFWLFQAMIEVEVNDKNHTCPILSTAIGIDESTIEGRERLDYFRNWFRELKADFKQREASETRRVLCRDGWEDWSFDEIVEGMDKRGSAFTQLHAEDYQRTLQVMSEQERGVFLSYMQQHKENNSITKYDTRGFYSNTDSDIESTQAAMCESALRIIAKNESANPVH